jgi:hypothetical protein
MGEIAEMDFSHLASYPNLQASNGYESTHTHDWVYKCISRLIKHHVSHLV